MLLGVALGVGAAVELLPCLVGERVALVLRTRATVAHAIIPIVVRLLLLLVPLWLPLRLCVVLP